MQSNEDRSRATRAPSPTTDAPARGERTRSTLVARIGLVPAGLRRPARRSDPITHRINLTQFVTALPLPRGATARLREGWAEQRPSNNVEPSPWTANHRWSVMGTAFDLAIGDRLDRIALRNVCERANAACSSRDPRFHRVPRLLRRLIGIGPTRVRADGTRRRHRDYYRALLLLAEMDSVFRSGGAPVPDAIFREGPIDSLRTLRLRLRAAFSVDAVRELHALLANALLDVASMTSGDPQYNPMFGCAIGPTRIAADGDLQIDDLLIDFKVSIREALTAENVRQLLGYAALDHLGGAKQIERIGLYNPRRREGWVCSVDEAARRIGWRSFEEFVRLFEATAMNPGP